MAYEATVSLAVDASHQLSLPYESKCNNLHGHRYNIEVKFRRTHLNQHGMVIDFVHVKKVIRDVLDHQSVNLVFEKQTKYKERQTTAENIAEFVYDQLQVLLNLPQSFFIGAASDLYKFVNIVSVRIWETPGNVIEFSPPGQWS